MLTIFQRMLLGGLLLLALIAGLSFLVRSSFVSLSAVDEEVKRQDRVASLARARAAIDREQVLVERSLLHLPSVSRPDTPVPDAAQPLADAQPAPRELDVRAQSGLAAERSRAPTDAAAGMAAWRGARAAHHRIYERLHRSPPDLATRMEAARALEPIEESVTRKLIVAEDARRITLNDLQLQREKLRARLIGACAAALLTGIVVLVATLVYTTAPLRRAARAARRPGEGALNGRLDWSRSAELGIIATEFNRMAIRLRDLRETESGRREMELQLSDAVVQSLFEPVIVTDGRGQLLKLNKAARALLGESADRSVLNRTEGGEQILQAIQTAVAFQRTVGGEGESSMAPVGIGGKGSNFRLRTTPMRDNEGHLLGAVAVLEDVTELQALDRFKTRFLSIASQKLRDPLEKLRVALHALARGYAGELRPLQADVIDGAQSEAQRLDELMQDLFDVAELDSGKRTLQLSRLRPLDVLREAQAGIHAAAAERGIAIEVDAFADLQRVEADRRALRSIFENLLTNAVRNTPAGGTVRLSAFESKNTIQFSVADTGKGIPADRLATIFGRFNSTSSDGTGLGLALVRRLVEAQNGQISVESREGAGATFLFTLPAAAAMESRHPVEAG